MKRKGEREKRGEGRGEQRGGGEGRLNYLA
jgi:hypothetical protein